MTTSTITPATKVAELLERWPELEPVLIAQAPAFKKLKNPVLRRTIARVASLEQAAAIAGLPVRDLVIALRRAAGQPVDERALVSLDPQPPPCVAVPGHGPEASGTASRLPQSAPGSAVIDADLLLNAGEVPLKAIFDAANALGPQEELRVLVSFRPAPMIERLEAHGFHCEYRTGTDGRAALVVTRIG